MSIFLGKGRRSVLRESPGEVVEFECSTSAAISVAGQRSDLVTSISKSKPYKGYNWKYKEYIIESEVWQKHPQHDIDCSNIGRVRNSVTKRIYTQRRISPGKKQQKQHPKYLTFHYKGATRKVHRLIAETFIANPDGKPTVDHLDSDPTNNHINNLRWATHKEQCETKRKNLPISPILDQ